MKLQFSNSAIIRPQLSPHADAASHIGSDDPTGSEVNVGSEFATGFSSGAGNEEQMPEPLSDESDAGCDTDLEIEGACWGRVHESALSIHFANFFHSS